jgi:poly(3-hydroxybutyrate) depolymerase
MNRSYVTCLSLISAALGLASCSEAEDGKNTPLGGTAGLAGAPGAGGMVGSAGTTGSAGTLGASGHGGSIAGGSGGTNTSAGMPGGGSAGSSGGGGAGMGGNGGGDAGNGGASGSDARSDGCGQAPKLMNGMQSIQSGGKNREFMIRVPEDYDNAHPYWLIFGFHWLGGTANDVDSGGTSGYTWSYYGLREQADESTNFRAIFVAPQGLNNGWGNAGNEDVNLTDDILERVQEGLCVDTKHIFSVGFSYGGGMTKALGCARPNVFRGLAVLAGADFLSGGCDGTTTSPVAFFGAHSISDGTNNYSSGITILNRFAANNGCTAQTPPQPQQGSNTHVCTKFAGCKEQYPVEWCAFNGGGHTPAPVDGSNNGSGGGDATWTKAEIWRFFTQLQ